MKAAESSLAEKEFLECARYIPGSFIIYKSASEAENGDGDIVFANHDFLALLGYADFGEFYARTGGKLSAVIHPDDFKNTAMRIREHETDAAHIVPTVVRCRAAAADGSYITVETLGRCIPGAVQDGRLWLTSISAAESSDSCSSHGFPAGKRCASDSVDSPLVGRTFLDCAQYIPGNFIIYRSVGEAEGSDGEIIFANPDFITLLGYVDFEDFRRRTGGKLSSVIHPEDFSGTAMQIREQERFLPHGGSFTMRCRAVCADGSFRLVETLGRRLPDAVNNGELWLTNVKAVESKDRAVQRDFLTGLLNKEAFLEAASLRLEACKGIENNLAFVWLDIENFKSFNERYGFVSGSSLLINLAITLMNRMHGALISRFSDDHFAVLTMREDIEQNLKDVYDDVIAQNRDSGLKLRAGIYIPSAGDDAEHSCDRAKRACDSIRRNYSVSHAFYREDMGRIVELRQHLISTLDDAIENGYIKVYYQPIVRALTGMICETEALVRWQDPKYGMLPPGEFISTLEQYRAIHKLDLCMLRLITGDYRRQKESGGVTLPSSLNLSRLDFELCDIFREVDRAMTENGVPKDMLKIEVTESVRGELTGGLKEGIEKFKRNGYEVWLDDFGSGYSSLSVLKDYSFDTVKFDMRFLKDFDLSEKAKNILSANITMVKRLGLHSLAEGVERDDQLQYLKSLGFEKLQGYLFSRPVPLEDLLALKIPMEDSRDATYYDSIGCVELLNKASTVRGNYSVADAKAMALVEYLDGSVTFLAENDIYRAWMKSLGLDAEIMSDTGKAVPANNTNGLLAAMIARIGDFDRRLRSEAGLDYGCGRDDSFYTYANGNCILVRMIRVAYNARTGASAYLLTHTDITRFPQGHSLDIKPQLTSAFGDMFEMSPERA